MVLFCLVSQSLSKASTTCSTDVLLLEVASAVELVSLDVVSRSLKRALVLASLVLVVVLVLASMVAARSYTGNGACIFEARFSSIDACINHGKLVG